MQTAIPEDGRCCFCSPLPCRFRRVSVTLLIRRASAPLVGSCLCPAFKKIPSKTAVQTLAFMRGFCKRSRGKLIKNQSGDSPELAQGLPYKGKSMRNRGVSSPMPFLLIPRSLLRGGFIGSPKLSEAAPTAPFNRPAKHGALGEAVATGECSARAPLQAFLSYAGVETLGPLDLRAERLTGFPGPMPAICALEPPHMQPQHDGMLQDG